tara:strand:- start:1129 stop:1269 length:141 start_codon:yes stop_codon:yes gene_type:complete
MIKIFFFAQEGLGVDIASPLGLFILMVGIIITVGLPLYMIKFGRKD